MKFGELLKTHKTDLVISRRYDAWIKANSNPHFSDEAIKFMHDQILAQRTPRDRRGSVSASALGKCLRRQQFTFIGLPELEYSAKTSAIFVNGTFVHLRWQMAGLTEGFLTDAECPIPPNEHRLSGTLDAIAYDGSVVEIKSCNSGHFGRVTAFGPLYGHEDQLGTYVLATGAEKGIFIYEDKNTQEFKEIVKHRDELPLETIQIRVAKFWESLDGKVLAEPLDQVYEGKAPCSSCPFRNNCLEVKTWSHAEEMADAFRSAG